jgi:Peptidase propeptide and YPEB domain
MMMRRRHLFAVVPALPVLAALAAPRPAAAREPAPEERARIEAVLRSLGYAAWDEIELDDGRWKIEEAKRADGKEEFNLWLDPVSLQVVRIEED